MVQHKIGAPYREAVSFNALYGEQVGGGARGPLIGSSFKRSLAGSAK
jgi:hypothetical protein